MTREEAIKIIDCYDIGFYDLSGEKIPADKLADAFDMAIEALSAEAVQGWIPCSERLPKEKERVLTSDFVSQIDFGQYDKGQWFWEAEACTDCWLKNDGVIAWMPLPKPYREENKE